MTGDIAFYLHSLAQVNTLPTEPCFEHFRVRDPLGVAVVRKCEDVLVGYDEIGRLANLQRAGLLVPLQVFRTVDRVGVEHVANGHALAGLSGKPPFKCRVTAIDMLTKGCGSRVKTGASDPATRMAPASRSAADRVTIALVVAVAGCNAASSPPRTLS